MKKVIKYDKTKFMQNVIELFATKGYAGCSLRDIAEKNGFNKSVATDHHQSKRGILKDVLDYVYTYENETLFQLATLNNINRFCSLVENYIVENPYQSSLVISLYNELLLDKGTEDFINSYLLRYKEAFEKFLPKSYSTRYKQNIAEQLVWQLEGVLVAYRIYKNIQIVKTFFNQLKIVCNHS